MIKLIAYSSKDDMIQINNSFVEAVFAPQLHQYDCGFACIKMIYKWSKISSLSVNEYTIENEIQNDNIINAVISKYDMNTPLWTIEMYQILCELSIPIQYDCIYYTKCFGISSDHSELDWYKEKEDMSNNRLLKIIDLFQYGLDNKWNIIQKTISTEYIIQKLSQGSIIIALINSIEDGVNGKDARLAPNSHPIGVDKTTSLIQSNAFIGHYVVVIGYEHLTNEFLLLNPDIEISDTDVKPKSGNSILVSISQWLDYFGLCGLLQASEPNSSHGIFNTNSNSSSFASCEKLSESKFITRCKSAVFDALRRHVGTDEDLIIISQRTTA